MFYSRISDNNFTMSKISSWRRCSWGGIVVWFTWRSRRENVKKGRCSSVWYFTVFNVCVVLDLIFETNPILSVWTFYLILNAGITPNTKTPFKREDVGAIRRVRYYIASSFRIDQTKASIFCWPSLRTASWRGSPTVKSFTVEKVDRFWNLIV